VAQTENRKRLVKRGIHARLWDGKTFVPGWMTWQGGKIQELRFTPPSRARGKELEDLGSSRILPGFVDTLLHGFGGVDCGEGNAVQLDRMSRALAASGVTSAMAGFYPLSVKDLRSAAKRWQTWKRKRGGVRTRFVGWHIEGPFLQPGKRGALPRRDLQKPSARTAAALLKACDGWLRLCTIAPELPGALEAADVLRTGGVIPSIGHTDAGILDCTALAANGPCAITHMGNRLPPLSAREPGPIGFAMEGGAQWVGVIPDMVHVAPETLRLWARTPKLRQRLMATSDNLSHAGLPADGFRSGGKKLQRSGAVAVDAQGNLSGTLDPLPELLLRALRDGYLNLAEVVRLGCQVPGALLGDCGTLEIGKRADFLVLEEDRSVGPVWIGGRRVVGA
jgi:N-acetylglucosamine-6-phosphate deacetylase